jgi:hypothetical protein
MHGDQLKLMKTIITPSSSTNLRHRTLDGGGLSPSHTKTAQLPQLISHFLQQWIRTKDVVVSIAEIPMPGIYLPMTGLIDQYATISS